MFMSHERRIRQLNELADLGVEVGRHLRHMAMMAQTPSAKADLAGALAAIIYEVRRTVDLELRMIQEDGRPLRMRRPDRGLQTVDPPDGVKH
jgi:hypothetical protein